MDARSAWWDALVRIVVCVEGGGDTNATQIECRKAFSTLLERAGFAGRMPQIIACGSRNNAFKVFKSELRGASERVAVLLVDSEDPVSEASPWAHLKIRDNWDQPANTTDAQVQLMTTCMETWISTDLEMLKSFFGQHLNVNKLLPIGNLEERPRDQVQAELTSATSGCRRDRAYQKGERSFRVLGNANPNVLMQHSKYFKRFVDDLTKLQAQ